MLGRVSKSATLCAGMYHGISSLANLGNLIAGVAHITWLASLLQNVAL